MELRFGWDEEKAKKNLKNHKISFEEAKTVFNDPFLLTFSDPDHSVEEQRYVSIGKSSKGRIVIVIHTDRNDNIRIISSRKATKSERKSHEEGSF